MSEQVPPLSGLSLRELLLEVRADIRAIDTKLENKADRSRVHDLANVLNVINIERASERVEARDLAKKVAENAADISALKAWRNKLTGAFALLVLLDVGTIAVKLLG